MAQSDWTPALHEREYYRHATTGDLGFLVRRGGQDCIKMDHGAAPEEIREYYPHAWIREEQHFPFVRSQVAEVAFAADRKLCYWLGLHKEAKREWRSLPEDERIRFTEKGPVASTVRNDMWTAIMGVLGKLAR